MWKTWALAIGLVSLLWGNRTIDHWKRTYLFIRSDTQAERWHCRPFLPNLFVETSPTPASPILADAARLLDMRLTDRLSSNDIDSLSVAVVTSGAVLYEGNFGVMRANETNSGPTHSHSIYRIASVSKLFNVLEGFVLEQKGLISWDEPLDKYVSTLQYVEEGLDKANETSGPRHHTPITLRQLATHMSGLGRDWPPGTVAKWPYDMQGMGPPPTNGLPFPSYDELLRSVARHHLVSPPGTYPAYSNAGTALLAYAFAVASSSASGHTSKIPYADLLKRDIFEPMGLNGSSFLVTNENEHLVVVPSHCPEVVDQDLLDAMNPAAGQYSSLSDLITVTQTLLNARHPRSQLTEYSRNKWLQPVFTFEEDDWTELGFIWEIVKAPDSNGRLRKIYWKLGAMAGHHAALAIHPGTGYGVVVLMAGHYPDAAKLAYDTFELFQPAIDATLAEMAATLYVGEWRNENGAVQVESSVHITLDKGTLYVEKYMLLGIDALKNFGATGRLALRSSGRRDEFRLDTGIPGYNGQKHMGCYPYWNGQDLWGIRNSAAVNLLFFTGADRGRRLHIPSLSMTLERM